ncbi:MAG: modulated sigma54 specific transcriptional regulator, Fis family [Amycolatopsis sp.]|uniref:sigma-54-dependent Fis family transcriptional regulator n=1 Tax=Amycolatopsis sp. TaxID=37632 RepID=UPI0026333709|nr:helix-turn-helix domain-containing protein [Amycolatopsis sp.]MCU1683580.1 modulated sigma54 specific transcriptional regulator, Fis family [Amycolatopsis sp.]
MADSYGQGSSLGLLAEARERFLSAESVDERAVRSTILASWWRSRTWNVAADHVESPYVKDPNLETPLTQSAGPVLARLQEQLNGSAVSVILTDDRGLVLDRRTDDPSLERHLDRVQLARGFSYAEEFVGTNGIGTALEGRQPTAVFGHEHYAENLDMLGCAGVPIRHPISGQVVGLLDLTCWRKDAGPLLLTLAKATVQDIQHELTTQVGIRELSLFTEYLRACRRGQGIVFAVNNSLVMLNEHARRVLAPGDQAALLARGAEVLTARRQVTLSMDLPSGATARLSCTPVSSEAGPAGGIVRVRLTREAEFPAAAAVPIQAPLLPGIVGSGALWLRACNDTRHHRQNGEWTVLEGERGTGKLSIAKAVHDRQNPTAPFTVLDFAQLSTPDELFKPLAEALDRDSGTVVLSHLDQMPPEHADRLVAKLDAAALRREDKQDGPWLVATMAEGQDHAADDVLECFPRSVPVPPLRHHIEDIRELVPFLLLKLGQDTRLVCSPAAVQLLLRNKWPGNVSQLKQVLRKVERRRRAGTIEPEDLPPECRTVNRRILSPLESMERDAIVRSLLDAEGNKAQAAKALGMSRATIYRKIHDYGIDVPH